MGLSDIIIFLIYVLIFYLLFAFSRRKNKDPLLRKYQVQGFWIKIISTVAMTIFNVYISVADSILLYYNEGIHMYRTIIKDFSNIELLFLPGNEFDASMLNTATNIGYFMSEGNTLIIKLVAFFSFFSMGRYMPINLFFSMVAFSGAWKLFRFFYDQYPRMHKQLAIAIIYLPTFVFWSSGVLKDPICAGMLGWLTWCFYKAFIKKENIIINICLGVICSYVLGSIKIYILLSYIPFFILFLMLKHLQLIKRLRIKIAYLFAFVLVFLMAIQIFINRMDKDLEYLTVNQISESVQYQQKVFIDMYDRAESSFSLGVEYDGSTGSLLKTFPAAVVATLYRPFLWESKKITTLLSSIESLIMVLFTLYVIFKTGIFFFIKKIIKNPLVLYCFCFAILFSFFIGATTLNFGTLVRYKIPAMPFYLIALFVILFEAKHKKTRQVPGSVV